MYSLLHTQIHDAVIMEHVQARVHVLLYDIDTTESSKRQVC